MSFIRYSRRDWLCAAAITLLALALAACGLTEGLPYWGDDHSAYIAEGIAIADGKLAEQSRVNYLFHPTPMPAEAGDEGLVYVWGYPLMLSAVYKAVGFDRESYSSIIWYKLPLAICFALAIGAMFLFMRRRFARGWSAFIALLFMGSGDLFGALNILYSDLPFLLFSLLTLLLAEVFVTHSARRGRNVFYALLYGAAMWFTRELRLSGTTVCAAAALGHALCLFARRRELRAKDLWVHALPYLACAVLSLVSERLILMPATSNTSDVARVDFDIIRFNIRYYCGKVYNYLDTLSGFRPRVLGGVLTALCALGIVTHGLRENLHLTLLLVGTLLVDVLLPYRQGLRYIYNILPLGLMFVAFGARKAWRWLRGRLAPKLRRPARLAMRVACVALAVATVGRLAASDLSNLRSRGEKPPGDVYSDAAVEVYHYIRDNVAEDAVVAFAKPRALYLNTERLSRRAGVNGFELQDADYYLLFKYQDEEYAVPEAETTPMEPVFENDMFVLSSILH